MPQPVDQFASTPSSISITFPAGDSETVVPSDTVNLATISHSLYVGVTGNLAVVMKSGKVETYTAVAVGYHPLQVQRVNATNTTATNIVSLLR